MDRAFFESLGHTGILLGHSPVAMRSKYYCKTAYECQSCVESGASAVTVFVHVLLLPRLILRACQISQASTSSLLFYSQPVLGFLHNERM
jgi:hypothetical protein